MTDVVKPVVSWESGNSAGINAINAEAINTINVIKSLEEKVETAIKGVLLANQQEGDDYLEKSEIEKGKRSGESVAKGVEHDSKIQKVQDRAGVSTEVRMRIVFRIKPLISLPRLGF
ncbi:hypothetical protein QYF36_024970 [Acer negundo]|nr:hypothetical protein QYF36_005078 [Acer negundo]KAK4847055.1 hypothetical protein QYF36_024970 [Acer negundo]